MSDSCHPMDRSPPGASVHGCFQARALEWVAIASSRGSSRPRNQTRVSCIVGRRFTISATGEVLGLAMYGRAIFSSLACQLASCCIWPVSGTDAETESRCPPLSGVCLPVSKQCLFFSLWLQLTSGAL